MKMQNDEYSRIYEQYSDSGFEFTYNNKRLGKSKPIFKEDIGRIEPSKRNHDDIPLFVKCGACGEYMDFSDGPTGVLDGAWKCPICGTKVREQTAYMQLDRENSKF